MFFFFMIFFLAFSSQSFPFPLPSSSPLCHIMPWSHPYSISSPSLFNSLYFLLSFTLYPTTLLFFLISSPLPPLTPAHSSVPFLFLPTITSHTTLLYILTIFYLTHPTPPHHRNILSGRHSNTLLYRSMSQKLSQ